MDNQPDSPRRRRRRRRPNDPSVPSNGRRWKNPATPLQAARFERRWIARDVINRVRALCPGHSGTPCRMDASKLSDYENGKRRPGLTHVEVFCRLYQKSPEVLGLIHWRDHPGEPPATGTGGDSSLSLNGSEPLQPTRFDRLLAGPSEDEQADELLIELLAEAVALTSAASVACRELRTALKDRAAVTLA